MLAAASASQSARAAGFLGTVILGGAMERLPLDLHDAFLAEILGRLPEPFEADYVRLNIDAIA